jgi:hypothetical protein
MATTMAKEQDERRPRPRWKGGRPRLAASRRRGAALPPVRMTAGELAAIAAAAASCGLTLSELVRRRLLGRRLPRPVPRVNREAWSRLGPLAANLNQYVRAIHQGQAAGAPLALLEDLRRELAALRLALVDDPEDQ